MDNEIVKVTFEGVFANGSVKGFRLGWSGSGGFGKLQIKASGDGDDGIICVDSEHMSKEFVIAVLTKLVNDAILLD